MQQLPQLQSTTDNTHVRPFLATQLMLEQMEFTCQLLVTITSQTTTTLPSTEDHTAVFGEVVDAEAVVDAVEAAAANVRVNSVHPSPVNTRMMRSLEDGFSPGHGEEVKNQLASTIPLGRYGESADIANLVLFLASDESAFITGAQYPVDGGMAAT